MYVFFKQKTADEMRISDWSSDVCSSDLWFIQCLRLLLRRQVGRAVQQKVTFGRCLFSARFWHSVSNRPTSDPHCCLYVRSLDGRVLAGHRTTNARADRANIWSALRGHAIGQDRKSTRLNSSH